MIQPEKITFAIHPSVEKNPTHYNEIRVSSSLVVESYRQSLFSYEWLWEDGRIRAVPDLPAREQDKCRFIMSHLHQGSSVVRSILGIGMMDNIEFGAGRAEFLLLAGLGMEVISVHVLKSQKEDFKAFLAEVK